MRNIIDLIRRDLRHATRNVMAGIVLFGLVVIPSLFTWFNVIASWDPFENASNLKVAVASTDAGYQSDLMPVRINVGEQVLSQLRANDALNWVITSEEDAIDGTRSGEYYAAVVLPASFSTDMMTFYTNGSERTSLDFYTNEKKNALAPKLTEQGAEGISAQISETFTETLGDVAVGMISSLSDYLTDENTQAMLTRVESRVGNISLQLRSSARTTEMLTSLVDASIPLVDSAESLVSAAGGAFGDTKNALGGGAAAVEDLKGTLQGVSSALSTALDASTQGYDAVAAKIDAVYASGQDLSAAQADELDALAGRVQAQIDATQQLRDDIANATASLPQQDEATKLLARLDDSIARQTVVRDRLTESAQSIRDGNAKAQESHDKNIAAINDAKAALEAARTSYESGLKPQLDKLGAAVEAVSGDVSAIRQDLAAASDGLSGAGGSVRDVLDRSRDATSKLSKSLTDAADKFDKIQKTIKDATNTGDLSKLSEVIGSDPGTLATSLANPVRVDRTAVFPVAGFGVGVAPLYMVLALWVGALLMTVTIRTDVNSETLPDRDELSPTEQYLGRYGIFALVGLAQSTLLSLGLILFVQIEPAHPFLLVFASWMISLVFTLIIYTAVVAFGNAGKALAVLLLVIQVSGAGGAYPLPLLPAWFQNVSPFLPATYAVDALRAAVAGVHNGDFWVAIGMLLLFTIPALLLGLVLRRPLMSFNRGLIEAVESTKLM